MSCAPGLRAADAALFVVPASAGPGGRDRPGDGHPVGGVRRRRDAARRRRLPVRPPACGRGRDGRRLPGRLRGGRGPALPAAPATASAMSGLYGLISQTPEGAAPPDADDARATLLEGIIEQSEDETLMERYLGGEEIDTATLIDDLETAVARGSFHPVVPVCAMQRHRARRPAGAARRRVPVTAGAPAAPRLRDRRLRRGRRSPQTAEGPLAAEVVRTSADAYVGRVSLVRVFSGTLRPETSVHVSGHVPRPTTAVDGDLRRRRPRRRRAARARLRPRSAPSSGRSRRASRATSPR